MTRTTRALEKASRNARDRVPGERGSRLRIQMYFLGRRRLSVRDMEPNTVFGRVDRLLRPVGVMLRDRGFTADRAQTNGRYDLPVDEGQSPGAARWEEQWPGNVCGVASALTTCSAMGRWGAWRLKAFFWVRYHVPPVRRWDARPLVKLSFIHFAQWALIDRLPGNDGMDDERLRPRYLLFLTNFNGGFDEYIDAFSHVIGLRIRLIWSGGPGFPGPEPATTFKQYIHRQEFPAAHFYGAYPGATVPQIRNALRTADRFDAFLAAADDDAFTFADAWTDLLTDIERSL
jgi:hypothetical protein